MLERAVGVVRGLDPVPMAGEKMFRFHAAGRAAWDREPAAHASMLLSCSAAAPGHPCLQRGSAQLCQPG